MNIETFVRKGQKAQKAVDKILADAAKERRDPDWNVETPKLRQSRVINRDYVRKWALDYANSNRAHKFERVSDKFLLQIERATKDCIRFRVDRHPSRGKTLK